MRMNKNFIDMVAQASANKDQFDISVDGIKETLDDYIKGVEPAKAIPSKPLMNISSATGWLRGALSYPWVLACLLIPSIEELL